MSKKEIFFVNNGKEIYPVVFHQGRGRKKPYSARGIKRVPCAKCGTQSTHQWQVCSNDNLYMGVCEPCDIALNRMVLEFFQFPDVDKKMRKYIQSLIDTNLSDV